MSPRLNAQKLVRPPSRCSLHLFLILREKVNQIIYVVPFFSPGPQLSLLSFPFMLFSHCYCRYLYFTHISYRFDANIPTYMSVCGKYRICIVVHMYHILYMTYIIHCIHIVYRIYNVFYIGYIMYFIQNTFHIIYDIFPSITCWFHIMLYFQVCLLNTGHKILVCSFLERAISFGPR